MRTDSSPSLISISAMPDSSSSSMSFLTLRISIRILLFFSCECGERSAEKMPALLTSERQVVSRGAQRQLITERTESRDRADGDIGEIRVMAEGLPRMHVAQMHFDERNLHAQQRVAQRHAGVRERRRIEDDAGHVRSRRLVNASDQLRFGVALEIREVMTGFGRQLPGARHDLFQRDGPVRPRLARAEQVQVGTVEQQQMGHTPRTNSLNRRWRRV